MRYLFPVIASIFAFLTVGCSNSATEDSANGADSQQLVVTPVSVCTGSYQSLKDSIVLNAFSKYLMSVDIKANINGYIKSTDLHLGDQVKKGQLLFVLQTKESESLGNTINNLDSSFKFSGISRLKSTTAGYITMINHQVGDYVQDGEILASITDKNSFGFILNLPFQYRGLLHMQQQISIELPDNTKVQGVVSKIMQQMDSISQTQKVFLKSTSGNIPSNLLANVVLITNVISGFTLPKTCIYTNENQQQFWVMKLLNDSTAVKMPITKIFENDSSVVLSALPTSSATSAPALSVTDRFVAQGGYGLSDTAHIRIEH
ncbi:hypothetical protein GCM10027566_04500 [Arachidicoccus ginsenosidivorans]|uniref:HlyD family efflux transporter periplasmic adaptor subunit n=1 Tax=Arachidicoccus ginsenosidivorans TaxID=496057 RepID=A0A5B8VQE1_9BACT|nr:efflux RND transporter periplasmic adaptor subunit [Arachidicoccus ginsenosidivorans]QEC73864.1 HlyD family efflux transporter periplasmic adaptor subunit [Arachidicoccus ginsenosidivorans]